MDLRELKSDIEEREKLLQDLDKSNPLYPIMYSSLLERKEKYDILQKVQSAKEYKAER